MFEFITAAAIIAIVALAFTLVLDIRSSRRFADIEKAESLALRRLLENQFIADQRSLRGPFANTLGSLRARITLWLPAIESHHLLCASALMLIAVMVKPALANYDTALDA
jgi:hypothetical protein